MMEVQTKNNKNYFQTRKAKQTLFLLSLVIIPLIHFAVMWVYINFNTILLTFQEYDGAGSYKFIGFERYKEVFRGYVLGLGATGPSKQRVYLNSLRSIVINIIILPIAFIASYSFYKKIRFEKFFRVVFMLPSIISLVVLTMVYRYLFSNEFGPIALLIRKMTGETTDWLGQTSDKLWPLIYIFAVWSGLATNVIMMSGAMLRIPGDITDSCLIDGVSFWREAVQIVLPLIMPTIGIYLISIVTSCLGFTMQPMLIAGSHGADNKFLTMGWYIFDITHKGVKDQMLQASTVGIVFSMLVMPVVILVRVLVKKFTPEVSF